MSVCSIGLGGKERSTQLWNLCWMDERKENGLLGREPYCLSVTVVVADMKSKADREHIPWNLRPIMFRQLQHLLSVLEVRDILLTFVAYILRNCKICNAWSIRICAIK